MKVIIDTSVWVEYFRDHDLDLILGLDDLLDANEVYLAEPVRIEILSGTSKTNIHKIKRVFSTMFRQYPSFETWALIDDWVERAVVAGHRFGLTDLLIGAIAAQNGALIWSLDNDFKRMAKLGFIELYPPTQNR